MFRVLISKTFTRLPELRVALESTLKGRYTLHEISNEEALQRSNVVRVVLPIRVTTSLHSAQRCKGGVYIDNDMLSHGFSPCVERPNGIIIKPFRDYIYDPRGVLVHHYNYTV